MLPKLDNWIAAQGFFKKQGYGENVKILLCRSGAFGMGSWYYICFALCVQFGWLVFSLSKGTAREKRTYCFIEHPKKYKRHRINMLY
jgi:hypothetical protein